MAHSPLKPCLSEGQLSVWGRSDTQYIDRRNGDLTDPGTKAAEVTTSQSDRSSGEAIAEVSLSHYGSHMSAPDT